MAPLTPPTIGGSSGTWGSELNALLATLDTRSDPATAPFVGKARPKVADGIFSAVDTALDAGRSTAIQVQGDSTGNAADEWVYMLGQWLAARHAGIHVKYKVWDDANQRYGAWSVLQAGTSGERHALFGANARSMYCKAANIPMIAGDIDIRWRGALDNYARNATQTLVARYQTTRSWRLELNTSNRLTFAWSADGTTDAATVTSTAAVSVTNGAEVWFRVTLDVDNGAGGRACTLYQSTDGITWTNIGSSSGGVVTSLFDAGTLDYEIGGRGLTGGVMLGKVFEVQIRNGIDGNIVNPQPIDSWAPRGSSGSFVPGSFGGSGTLYVVNGSHPGASYTYLSDATRHPKMVHPYAGCLNFQSCSHNDADSIDAAYVQARTDWLALTDARTPGAQTVVLTQNPEYAPNEAHVINYHARRRQLLIAWAARKGLACIDTYKAFLDNGGSALVTSVDGIHPTASVGDGTKGEDVWLKAITDAWAAAV